MAPPTLPPPPSPSTQLSLLPLERLTPSSFAPFGTAISPPFPPTLTVPPTSTSAIPSPLHPAHQPQAILANQNSALKTISISPFINSYPSTRPAKPQMSMFSCFPRNLSGIGIHNLSTISSTAETIFKIDILERHPFTTQTFSPLGLSPTDSSTVFLVIVAPSLPSETTALSPNGQSTKLSNPPDLSRLRAFVAKGNQAVTYAPGTWHAPMVVLGSVRVDFLVSQFVNGWPEDDCQEVLLGGNAVGVGRGGLRLEESGTGKARL